jgi:hypothetical protein
MALHERETDHRRPGTLCAGLRLRASFGLDYLVERIAIWAVKLPTCDHGVPRHALVTSPASCFLAQLIPTVLDEAPVSSRGFFRFDHHRSQRAHLAWRNAATLEPSGGIMSAIGGLAERRQ